MKKMIALAALLSVIAVASASAATGKELYEKDCAKCHGADGAGKTKMGEKLKVKDYTDAKVQAEMKDPDMTKAIKEGIKEGESTKMKGYGDVLSDDDIKALVSYIRAFKK